MNALRRIRRSLVKGGVLLDLQPMLDNAPATNSDGELGRLDEREFRAFADRVNLALEGTVSEGLFAYESEASFDVVHRFNGAAELLAEVKTWRGTTVPPSLLRGLEQSRPPLDVHEGAKLRRFRAL